MSRWTAEPRVDYKGAPRVAVIRPGDGSDDLWADTGCAYILPVEEARQLAHGILALAHGILAACSLTNADDAGGKHDEASDRDLGRYAAGRAWFRWMPGMLRDDGHRFIGIDPTGEEHGFVQPADEGGGCYWIWPQHLVDARCSPDLSDPATVGCLLALAEDLAGGPVDLDVEGEGLTRAVALVRLCDALHALQATQEAKP